MEHLSYSVDDAAAAVGLSAKTIRNAVGRGDLRAARVGTRMLIPRAELEAFIAARVEESYRPAAVGTAAPAYGSRKAG